MPCQLTFGPLGRLVALIFGAGVAFGAAYAYLFLSFPILTGSDLHARVQGAAVVALGFPSQRAAGAIILAKSNLPDFASLTFETVSSLLPGYTRNPYDLAVTTAGSSGGTATAIAANFGVVGLGTDTGNSIRGPAAFLSLVGLRPTVGLVSSDGIVPLDPARDVTRPMTRTVADAALLLDVIAAEDPAVA